MNDMRRCLAEIDVPGIRALWSKHSPHLPQPKDDVEALAGIHRARTEARSMTLRQRAYSHRWLLEHGLPSGLPDDLKPSAERLYPMVVEGVGISVMTGPIKAEVRGAMQDAVLECYADGHRDAAIVKARMMQARRLTFRKLLGIREG